MTSIMVRAQVLLFVVWLLGLVWAVTFANELLGVFIGSGVGWVVGSLLGAFRSWFRGRSRRTGDVL